MRKNNALTGATAHACVRREGNMKVLHLISGGDSGGAKTCLFSLYSSLRHLADIRVACLFEGAFYRDLPDVGVDYVLFRQKNRFDLSVVNDIARMINDEGFDILHVHGARANFVASFVKNKISAPVVTTMHSDYLYDFESPVKKILFTGLNIYALRKIPYYVTVSDTFRCEMIRRGFKPNSVYTVYNGMDFSKVPSDTVDRAEYCRRHGFEYDPGKIYIGTAARLEPVKGVDVFIKAAGEILRRYNNVEFLIAGDGSERDRLERTAKETGHGDSIRFLGYERDIYSFYNLIDINTLASRSEGLPYSMLEGAAVGKAFAASRVGGIPTLVRDGETGLLFEPEDHCELAEKLALLIDSPDLRQKLGDNIKARVMSEFSAERFARDYFKVYENLLRDHADVTEYKKHYDYIFSGYYGFDNNGDDAVILSLTEKLKLAEPDARIAVLAHDPKRSAIRYGIDTYGRMRPFALYGVIKKSHVLLSGGGSLLQDETSVKSLYYYLYVIRIAKKYGLPVMMIGNGVGPLHRQRSRTLTAKIINECVDDITLRDEDSMELLNTIGVTAPKTLAADPALLLSGKPKAETERLMRACGIPEGEYITVSLREWRRCAEDMETSVAAVLCRLRDRYRCSIVFVPMQMTADTDISCRIAAMIGEGAYTVSRQLGIKDIIGLIGGAKLNIAMRLHATVYSVSEGVPTVALRYDPKVSGFMRYAGLRHVIDVKTLTADELYHAAVLAMSTRVDIERRDELRKKAMLNIEHAVSLKNKEKSRDESRQE